jgi:MFS family permease
LSCNQIVDPPEDACDCHRPDHEAPHQLWTVVFASIGVFMTALDTRVVTTSLAVLKGSLHASLSSLEWTINAYNLVTDAPWVGVGFSVLGVIAAPLAPAHRRPHEATAAGLALSEEHA